jgi:predicted nucleotidyltransferase
MKAPNLLIRSLLRPLIKNLQEFASEIVLYGSCARGEDVSTSDVDLFVVSAEKEEVLRIIGENKFRNGFKSIRIAPVIISPVDMLKSEKTDKEFLSLVREGIILFQKIWIMSPNVHGSEFMSHRTPRQAICPGRLL